ncbi:MAG: phosphoribosyltransferase family protein [Candidatus Kaiserbacteria bacterium]|nr:phosphoribosyltransferase family protein [Candidatus Kaiserbacteria bacterium]
MTMTQEEVMDSFQKVGMFLTGHFALTSGKHAGNYLNKDALYTDTVETSRLCHAMAEYFAKSGVGVVIGPAIGAAILAQWVAYHLTKITGHDVSAAYADKDGQGGFVLKRGYDAFVKGKKTLIVEDLTTTGGSVRKVVETVRSVGAEVVGVVVLANRGAVTKESVGNPPIFEALVDLDIEAWEPDECELCKKGIPVNTDVGHGKEYLAKKQ